MTRLRKMMLEELQRRNYSQDTARHYIRTVEEFARRFNCPPDRLVPRHIREYQAELFQKRKLSPGTVINRLSALRFFYTKTLKKAWSVAETPYPKKQRRIPTILSQEEVARLIDAPSTAFHRTLLIALYATGLRCAELTRLKISDIDSQRMVIRVRGGKWGKDRDVMLSPKLLEELRKHWHRLRRKPSAWLFPGNRWHTGDHPMADSTSLETSLHSPSRNLSLRGCDCCSARTGWSTLNAPSAVPNTCCNIWVDTLIAWPSPTIAWSRLLTGKSPSAGGTLLTTTNRSS
jgi:integrase/recombinase XerD